MNEFEFLALAATEWQTLVAFSLMSAGLLFIMIRRIVVGSVFDPLVLALVVGYSVNYAVVGLLYANGMISSYFVFLVFGYGLTFIAVVRWASLRRGASRILTAIQAITPRSVGLNAYLTALCIYFVLSLYIISSIGFGIFAETNRFDAARGFGSYIRVLDFLNPFIVSYSTLRLNSARRKSAMKMLALLAFIVYAAMVNGAKISVIFSLFTVFFTLSIASAKVTIRPVVATGALIAGLAFSVLALSINLDKNNVAQDAGGADLGGAGLLVQRFVYRIVASGDTSYLLLPNDVIDKIDKDSVWVRFLAPFIGTGNITQLLGYNVGDYSIGRQALLYYDPGYEVFGGPTSHFDLFAYAYFGPVGGWFFVIGLALLLGSMNRAIRITQRRRVKSPNLFRMAVLATLWTRAVLVIIDPTVALAYIVDVVVFFAVLSLSLKGLARAPGRSARAMAFRSPTA